MKTKKTKVIQKISVDGNDIIKMVNECLPKIIQDEFSSSYSNPLKDALSEVLRCEEVKQEIREIVLDAVKSVKKTTKFKDFVREALVS